MRTSLAIVLILAAAGCSRPPSANTFTADPLPAAFVALHSPNGQRQALLIRVGTRWQGHVDDIFARVSLPVATDTGDDAFPEVFTSSDPSGKDVELEGWKPLNDLPRLIVEAWAAADPSLRANGPSSMVAMIRVTGDTPAIAAVNTSLAAELEGSVGLAAPAGDTLADPGAVASRVAIEAASRAVIDEDAGIVNPRARMAVLQIPVFLTSRFLAVEHFTFEDNGSSGGGGATSRFTLHDLGTGGSPDVDELLDNSTLEKLSAIASQPAAGVTPESPAGWYPSRPGIVLVFRADGGRDARRVVVSWSDALPLLPADSLLKAVAGSTR